MVILAYTSEKVFINPASRYYKSKNGNKAITTQAKKN